VHRLDAGVRGHFEWQERQQVNGDTPTSREPGTGPNGGTVERNDRRVQALALFVQDQAVFGRFGLTPGLRLEQVWYERVNALPEAPVTGTTSLTQLIPGLGATYLVGTGTTLFAGIHRGFAPPRVEDLIDNATGTVVDLPAELSWNVELGARSDIAPGLHVEATLYQMDFQNQIIPASAAGGTGATLTSAGQTLHRGVELGGHVDVGTLLGSTHRLRASLAWTWAAVARFEGERFAFLGVDGSDVPGKVYPAQNSAGSRTQVSVTGNRLPYAPSQLVTASLLYAAPGGLGGFLELVHAGSQFGDPVNTDVLIPDGQQGPLAASTIVNLAASWDLQQSRTTFFLALKNALDATYLVDRTRGMLPGPPRTVEAGISQRF
jgi:Fe(3+) dicitrate transport protein